MTINNTKQKYPIILETILSYYINTNISDYINSYPVASKKQPELPKPKMNTLIILALLAQVALVFSQGGYDYYVPRPKIKAINPRGIYMSIPHRPGIEEVQFHVNLNKQLDNNDVGQLAEKVAERWNGRWSFVDRKIQLNSGDNVYFWISVRKDGKEYRFNDGRFLVTEDAFSSEESHSYSSEERYRY